jgi:hypothetical protein
MSTRPSAVRPRFECHVRASEALGKRELRTGESKADVVIQHHSLANRARILQLKHGLLLHAEDDNIRAAHAYLHVYLSGG